MFIKNLGPDALQKPIHPEEIRSVTQNTNKHDNRGLLQRVASTVWSWIAYCVWNHINDRIIHAFSQQVCINFRAYERTSAPSERLLFQKPVSNRMQIHQKFRCIPRAIIESTHKRPMLDIVKVEKQCWSGLSAFNPVENDPEGFDSVAKHVHRMVLFNRPSEVG